MPSVQSVVLDLGLLNFHNVASDIYVCSQEPTTFAEATSTYSLGSKNFGAGAAVGAPAPGSPNGRKVSSTPISDGNISGTGTATAWAVIDATNSALLASGSLAAAQAVTSGNTFTLSTFDIRLPSQ
jgi:hypothetical protein